jgi:hypothetical protein
MMIFKRIKGVFRLDVQTFEEIEHDESATVQAAWIVGISGIVGSLIAILVGLALDLDFAAMQRQAYGELPSILSRFGGPIFSPAGLLFHAIVITFLGWFIWAAATYLIGTRLFGGQATLGEMLRVIGFARAPKLLSLLLIIPCLGSLLDLVGTIWMLVASFVGIRQGLDLSNGRTFVTVLVCFLVVAALNWFVITPLTNALAF